MNKLAKTLLSVAAALPQLATAQVSLKGLDRDMTGPRAQVLVLGTVHLSEMHDGFNAASLDGVINRLAAFKPDVITIEALSGEECDLTARHPTRYGQDYCQPTDVARASTGLDVPTALAAVDKALKSWPMHPTPAQRRQLASQMLAANDRASAYVQWLQLSPAERVAGDGLDESLVQLLGQLATHNNENYLIAARLAARLRLQRVVPIDNHTGDHVVASGDKAFWQELAAAWASGMGVLEGQMKRSQELQRASDLLPLYRLVNEPAYLQSSADVNVKATLRAKSATQYPQIWVGGWEVRNLRMVANIRESFRDQPGARVVSIVGASHKPWFDHWLAQMQGVNVVDAQRVLN